VTTNSRRPRRVPKPTIPRERRLLRSDQRANTGLVLGQERETAMQTAIKDCPICVALILAVVAAVMSMPREPGRPYQILEWMQIGACSEVNQLAGAIGETSAGCPSP
jgi:hypothetical protein